MTTSSQGQHFDVLGVSIDAVTTGSTVERIRRLVGEGAGGYIVFCTVSSVLSARDDPTVMKAIDQATVVTPDGMPLVWLGRSALDAPVDRVYGPDLMVDLIEATGSEFSHYFFGGRGGVAGEMVARLTARFPELRVAGWHEPATTVRLEDSAADIERIKGSGADLLWVGLGHPKQELWMQTHIPGDLPCVALGVGAAFDFHAGRKREAPRWMKRTGLQWLHRLVQEPRRLWRRYLVGNSRFLWLLATQRSNKKR